MKRFAALLSSVLFLFAVLLVTGCTDSAAEEEEMAKREEIRSERERDRSRSEDDLDDALSNLGNALEGLGQSLSEGSGVEPVDFRDLRDILPERIRGLEKGRYNGERTGTLGIKVSTVEQEYESENGDESVDITIVDLGSLRNVAVFGIDWLNLEVDREDDHGFERTTEIDGHPALEKCETSSQYERCEVHLLVGDRFVVDVKTRGMAIRHVHDILDDMDLRALEKMRHEGVPGQ